MSVTFPKGFLWGTATASYQIEGAAAEDGRGPSIWDTFSHTPGKVTNGDTGDVACDHYHRYADDVRLMTDLGAQSYRFSIAWSRILPEGKGAVNEAGLAFYDRLVDEICRAGIVPFATLYHWDLPQALEDAGGWRNRDTADHFAHYTDIISKRIGDRVKNWMTLNEPICIADLGHSWGIHAPGHRDMTRREADAVTHVAYLGHGKAVSILRANGGPDTKVGIVLNITPAHPASDSEADRAAAQRSDAFGNRWFADPIFKGSYPADALELLGENGPDIHPGDMGIISAPIDLLGVNYYFRSIVQDDQSSKWYTKSKSLHPESAEYSDMDWEIYPDGLREVLVRMYNDYQPKEMYVTENGCAMPDMLDGEGHVHDPRRVEYLRSHFIAARKAMDEGVPLKGYFVWSLMDNFEWNFGYTKRFGIVYTDYPTQHRIPKDSYKFYKDVISANAVPES